MIIKYYSAENKIIQRDLSDEIIIDWEIVDSSVLGYKSGNLIVNFCTEYLKKSTNEGGIYPPIKDIINYKESVDYLRNNFPLRQKIWNIPRFNKLINNEKTY